MKQNLSKISEYFQIEKLRKDKRVIVFSVCLLIATTLWFLNALSKDYSTTLSYPVKFIDAPKGKFIANELLSELELNVDAHGFALLRHKFSLSLSPIILDISDIIKNIENSPNGYRINTGKLKRQISNQVSNEIAIKNIQPEVFFIKLDSLQTKTVSVEAEISLDFKPQFHLKEPVIISPSKVEITGPAVVLEKIHTLKTENKTFEKLNATVTAKLSILHPEKTSLNTNKVQVEIPVEKFTEKSIKVPVLIENKPDSIKIKLFPSEIKISVLVGLSEFENINATKFNVFVDYNSINSETTNLKVNVLSEVPNLKIIRYIPTHVEYLIETN